MAGGTKINFAPFHNSGGWNGIHQNRSTGNKRALASECTRGSQQSRLVV